MVTVAAWAIVGAAFTATWALIFWALGRRRARPSVDPGGPAAVAQMVVLTQCPACLHDAGVSCTAVGDHYGRWLRAVQRGLINRAELPEVPDGYGVPDVRIVPRTRTREE